MGSTLELGRRIELVSMDPHCRNITIGLYELHPGGEPGFVVHSYSGLAEARTRLEFLAPTMVTLGGMEITKDGLRFPCGAVHPLAVRRTFLEACKLPSDAKVEARPLTILDKKLNAMVTVTNRGAGEYEVSGDGPPAETASRLESITGGLRKLAELETIPGESLRVRFACGQSHDALVGLLLPRALNVRAVLREEEMAASRGVLVAPSAQK